MSDTPTTHPQRVGVVGAGIAGATAARVLAERGLSVLALDKGRGPGGRTSTRRDGERRFDHGAQYFTARDPAFRETVERWIHAGAAAEWEGRLVTLEPDGGRSPLPDEARYVGVPGMSEIVRATLAGVEARFGARATRIERTGDGWMVGVEDTGDAGPFDHLIVAIPAPQAAGLVRPVAPGVASRIQTVELAPCWSAMVTFREGLPDPGLDGARVRGNPILSWIGRDSSKPGRPPHDAWVAHATPGWSSANLERDAGDVTDALARSLAELLGRSAQDVESVSAHRWRYALASDPVGRSCLHDEALGLTVCGDWLIGPRVECAFLSGLAAAERAAPGAAVGG